ncbi:hypothetical protein AAFF_G00126830 [Aldrovandia affinis]|uniref:Uncharacterized protein n=1 Tax=Aldrovandia affinis TaxID=143900 RepID=A0AAD7WX15_9TELE|nr:hypothetical protein AAFF_G00126830 [Aldrovandia affinis]
MSRFSSSSLFRVLLHVPHSSPLEEVHRKSDSEGEESAFSLKALSSPPNLTYGVPPPAVEPVQLLPRNTPRLLLWLSVNVASCCPVPVSCSRSTGCR